MDPRHFQTILLSVTWFQQSLCGKYIIPKRIFDSKTFIMMTVVMSFQAIKVIASWTCKMNIIMSIKNKVQVMKKFYSN